MQVVLHPSPDGHVVRWRVRGEWIPAARDTEVRIKERECLIVRNQAAADLILQVKIHGEWRNIWSGERAVNFGRISMDVEMFVSMLILSSDFSHTEGKVSRERFGKALTVRSNR